MTSCKECGRTDSVKHTTAGDWLCRWCRSVRTRQGKEASRVVANAEKILATVDAFFLRPKKKLVKPGVKEEE